MNARSEFYIFSWLVPRTGNNILNQLRYSVVYRYYLTLTCTEFIGISTIQYQNEQPDPPLQTEYSTAQYNVPGIVYSLTIPAKHWTRYLKS